MMRKIFFLILYFLIFSANAQKKVLLNLLEEQITELEKVEAFQDVKLSLDYIEDDELENNRFVYDVRKPFDPTFFDSIPIVVETSYPYSVAEVYYNYFDLPAMLGEDTFYFNDNPEKYPIFIPQKVYFLNGDIADAADVVMKEEEIEEMEDKIYFDHDAKDNFLIKSVKPIKSISFIVTTNFGSRKNFIVTKKDKFVKIAKEVINVNGFSKNFITLTIPKELKKNMTVYGIHKNGKYLQKKGSFSKSSSIQPKDVEKLLIALYEAKDDVISDKIKSVAELKKKLDLDLINKSTTETFTVYFAAEIENVEISFKNNDEKVVMDRTYHTSDDYQKRLAEQPYIISKDLKSEKYGIIGLDGEWIAKPTFHKISQHNYSINHFQAAAKEVEDLNKHYYRLDVAGKKLVQVDYNPKLQREKNNADVLIVKDNVSNNEGLINRSTGNIIIPFKYYDLTFRQDNYIDAELKINKKVLKGILTVDNKAFIPIEFVYVKNIEPFFVGFDHGYLPEKIYNNKGNLLTVQFYVVGKQFLDGLLLVETKEIATKEEFKKDNTGGMTSQDGKEIYFKNKQYHFIDDAAKIKISLDMSTVSDVGEFYNGRAWIKDHNGLYGYIDLYGTVIIKPQFSYTVAMDFRGKYAVVEINDEYWFIDANGNKIKQLPDSPEEGGKDYIKLYNGDVYNYNGEQLKK